MSDNEDHLSGNNLEKLSPSGPEADELPKNPEELAEVLKQRAEGAANLADMQAASYEEAAGHIDTTGNPDLEAAKKTAEARMAEIQADGQAKVEAAREILDRRLDQITESGPAEEAPTVNMDRRVSMDEAYGGRYTFPETPVANTETAPTPAMVELVSEEPATIAVPKPTMDSVQPPAPVQRSIEDDWFEQGERRNKTRPEPVSDSLPTPVMVELAEDQPVPEPEVVDSVQAPVPAQPAAEPNIQPNVTRREQELRDKAALMQGVGNPEQEAVLNRATRQGVKEIKAQRAERVQADSPEGQRQQQEQARVESLRDLEEQSKKRYDTLTQLRDTMQAYDIAELRPALKKLTEELSKITPEDLKDEAVAEKLGALLDLALIQADLRLKDEIKDDETEKLRGDIRSIFDPVRDIVPGKMSEHANTADYAGAATHLAENVALLPLRMLKKVAWDMPKAVAWAGVLSVKAITGNLNRSVEQMRGLDKINGLRAELQALNKTSPDSVAVTQSRTSRGRALDASVELSMSRPGDPAAVEKFQREHAKAFEEAIFERLLEQVVQKVITPPTEDSQSILEAIDVMQKAGKLNELFKIAADGSVSINLPGHTLDRINPADVVHERKLAQYDIVYEKALREAGRTIAPLLFQGDRALCDAIQQGHFTTAINGQGEWVLKATLDRSDGEGMVLEEHAMGAEVTQRIFAGIDAGQVDKATQQFKPEYLKDVIKATSKLPAVEKQREPNSTSPEPTSDGNDDNSPTTSNDSSRRNPERRNTTRLVEEKRASAAVLDILRPLSNSTETSLRQAAIFIEKNKDNRNEIMAQSNAAGDIVVGFKPLGSDDIDPRLGYVTIPKRIYDFSIKPRLSVEDRDTLEA